jgi:putative transposase
MKKPVLVEDNPRDARALARFAAVQKVMQGVQSGLAMVQSAQQAAEQAWDGRFYAAATIEDWYYEYRRGKFAALQDQPRSDRGIAKAMEPEAVEALMKLRRENPTLTVRALAAELCRQGILAPGSVSESTLQRRLSEAGLDRQSLRAGSGLIGGPTKAFELPLPNILWMADCMHGPTIQTESGPQRTYLFALIDDCTRLLVHGQFYTHERLECFLDTLRQAVQTRGLVDKLYTDNGSAFRSQHLGIVCANLGIRLIHCRPYHAWSKGKIEKWFQGCQSRFLPTLVFEPVNSLEELNRRLWKWIEVEYNQRPHAALDGECPAERFARLGQSLRMLEANAPIGRLFFMRLNRRVRKDATISLGAHLWEVAAHLRGQIVTVRFDPISYARVEVSLGERFMGLAVRCDKQRNARILKMNDYDREVY